MKTIKEKDWYTLNSIIENIGTCSELSKFSMVLLSEVKRVIPYNNAHIILYNNAHKLIPRSYRINIPDKVHQQYLDYYCHKDDFFKKSFNTPYPKKSTSIMDYNTWVKTEYFNDFQKYNNYHYVCITDIHYNTQLLGSLSLVRGRENNDFNLSELSYLSILRPHIANHMYKLIVNERLQNNNESLNNIVSRNENKYNLTNRESQIARLIFKGETNEEISDILYISPETVKKHLHNIYRKVKVGNRTELTANLLNLEDLI